MPLHHYKVDIPFFGFLAEQFAQILQRPPLEEIPASIFIKKSHHFESPHGPVFLFTLLAAHMELATIGIAPDEDMAANLQRLQNYSSSPAEIASQLASSFGRLLALRHERQVTVRRTLVATGTIHTPGTLIRFMFPDMYGIIDVILLDGFTLTLPQIQKGANFI